jgi:hypothetical protein
MLHDFHQPQVSLSDWQKFGTEVSPFIDELMNRVEADLPHPLGSRNMPRSFAGRIFSILQHPHFMAS